jgi:hypothetical protein
MQGNIVTNMPFYRPYVLGLCPRLTVLDNIKVSIVERSNDKAIARKAGVQMEQLRTSELRYCVLSHMQGLLSCHVELIQIVVGKFR